MSIELNVTTDMEVLVDGTENITLQRRHSLQKLAITSARRQRQITQEATPSAGAAQQTDCTWHFSLPPGEAAPQLGDVLIDGKDTRWTILEVRELTRLGRWKCQTRNLAVAFVCEDRVDIQRPLWEDLGAGPEIVRWIDIGIALPVKIQPISMVPDNNVAPTTAEQTYRIILSEALDLEPGDRFVGETGETYTLQAYILSERLEVLPIAEVVRDETV